MGKRIVIKGANFSINAIEQLTPTPTSKIIDFEGSCQGSLVSYQVDLLSSSATDWVLFAQFAWQGGRTGEIRLFDIRSNTNVCQIGFTNNHQFYRSASISSGTTYIHTFSNDIRKIGFKKNSNHIYVTFNGTDWTQTEMVVDSDSSDVTIWGAVGILQCPELTELVLTVWDNPYYDISHLF